MAQQLDKIFPCLTCKKEIKLARNDANNGWLKFNLDGTEHKHEKKQQNSQPQPQQPRTSGTSNIITRLDRIERKLDLLLAHNGIKFPG